MGIKDRLGSVTDDPGKFIQEWKKLTLAYDLSWRDVNLIP